MNAPHERMRRIALATAGGRGVVALDTIAHVTGEDAGRIVLTGSHGGLSSGEYAARAPLAAVFFNDAGIGKDDAGIAALAWLDARGIVAGAVSHRSAIVGDAVDTWESGVVSALNATADRAGFVVGEPVRLGIGRVFGAAS